MAKKIITTPLDVSFSDAKNPLIQALRAGDGGHLFESNASIISYKTGFPVLDYYLGYRVNVFDEHDKIASSYPMIGIPAGSYILFAGKPSSTKTTTATQIAANIVRPFKTGTVIHLDVEQAMNYSRIQVLTKFPMSELETKYILRQENITIDDVYELIMKIYFEKTKNPERYLYNTGKLNEFGREIQLPEPTVVILDSIASLSMYYDENNKDDMKKLSELEGNTYSNRLARDISQMFTKVLPRLRSANIILIAINQIKDKIDVGITKTPPAFMYMNQNETLPGGWAPQFYAHIFLKFTALTSDKFAEEDDGFDGFGVKTAILKSRTNQAGQCCELIYDKVRGIDSVRTTIKYLEENGLVNGNKNKSYFLDNKDISFSKVRLHSDFKANPDLFKQMYDIVIPQLESRLSEVVPEELIFEEQTMDY